MTLTNEGENGFVGENGETPPLAHSSFSSLSRPVSRQSAPVVNSSLPGPAVYYSTDTLDTGTSSKRYLVPDDVSDGKQHFGVDENKERGNWTGKLDFLLSCLGYAVGLGNVWRFPYLCFRNGGGAFFIPYIIMLVFVGMPLFFMELSLGQFSSNSPLTCWKFAPLFKVGYDMKSVRLTEDAIPTIFDKLGNAKPKRISSLAKKLNRKREEGNIRIQALCVDLSVKLIPQYKPIHTNRTLVVERGRVSATQVASLDPLCSQNLPDVDCSNSMNIKYSNGSCYNDTQLIGVWNYTIFKNSTGIKRHSPTEEYYNNRVMRLSSGIDDMGPVEWDLAICLLGAWTIAFLCMIKGIKSSGKVVYFTALFPYVVLIILLGRGATLPNASEGVLFFIKPQWERLADAKVWNDAAVQIFFSLSNCWGGLIALSSYNRFHNNTLRDTLIVTLSNCGTSVFAGFVIFSFMGFMAGELNTRVADVVDSGPGLAFIVYPDAVSRMPLSPLWAILFFLMLITLGLDSQFAMLETLLTSIMDQFKGLRPHKSKVISIMCVVLFLLGLTMCSHGGAYMLQLMDTYCGGWAILIIGLMECVAVAWVYGAPRFMKDISVMTGRHPALWWRVCWQGISPALIVFILLFTWIDYTPARYGDDYKFPPWADAIGWMMTISSVIWIPIVAGYKIWKEGDGSFIERVRYLTLPTEEWGPALVKHRKLVDYVDGFVIDPWGTGTKKDRTQAFENWGLNYGNNNKTNTSSLQAVNGSIDFLSERSKSQSINNIYASKSQLSVGNTSTMSYESAV
ncbi:hypothetical protein LSH36_76g00075 [Paralvinella palmiformis]|uniref:Transporter n=1 Tax=Paralvinella palmiformis TaxID=53620 RepID=A0AAD9K3D3_9ANNE|nr:hypothetical protein LSH36_76g00075 [Paralvinella palmiformis]